MNNITYRPNYLKEEDTEGFLEYDLGSINFGNYDFGETKSYMVHYYDVGRPDIISQNIYGTSNLWWFVMWYNGIGDIWNDLRDGLMLRYPQYEMVIQAFKLYKK